MSKGAKTTQSDLPEWQRNKQEAVFSAGQI
jgi:hypothetical protein